MRTIFSELADVWACNRPSLKQVVGTIACCLALLGVLGTVEIMHQRNIGEIKAMLAANNYGQVKRQLDEIKGQAFCYNLVGRRDVYHVRIDEHNEVARLYNEAVARAPFSDQHLTFESMMQSIPISGADLNGIIFLAHINPWEDCYRRYGIAANR